MTLRELKAVLADHPDALPRFILPGGEQIHAHFLITEVGHVTKRFIDCGGTLHDRREMCVLQTWLPDDDSAHRLSAGTFARILQLGAQVLPHEEMDVEVEYEDSVITPTPITGVELTAKHIELQLGAKRTDCLAKDRCGIAPIKTEAGTVTSSCC